MNDSPTIFVAFGVTGDLMRLKILPALFSLYSKRELPQQFAILGVSRKELSNADLRLYVAENLSDKAKESPELTHFLQSIFFVQGDVGDEALYASLAESFEVLEKTWGTAADKVLYLSISPTMYKTVFEHLRHASFTQHNKRVKLMVEKPFGTSGKSAEKLQTLLGHTFDERALYRVDHYLAKDDLATIPQVDLSLVKDITITFFESGGVEKRGTFYDMTGALLDVGQNHMLEMFGRVVMKHSRAEALESLHPLTTAEVATNTVRGQYIEYKQVQGVDASSQTETYFKITTTTDSLGPTPVSVIFEGGKYMPETKKEIRITFTDGRVLSHSIGENKRMSEYERLICDCIRGNQTLFVSRREVAALWRFVDPILEAWRAGTPPLGVYQHTHEVQ